MSAPSGSTPPSAQERFDADLEKLDRLNESLAKRDRRIIDALRRVAKHLDRLTKPQTPA